MRRMLTKGMLATGLVRGAPASDARPVPPASGDVSRLSTTAFLRANLRQTWRQGQRQIARGRRTVPVAMKQMAESRPRMGRLLRRLLPFGGPTPSGGQLPPPQTASSEPSRTTMHRIGLGVVLLALAFSLGTYLILTGLTPILPTSEVVIRVLLVDLLLLLVLFCIVAYEIWQLWRARIRRMAGARLHIQIVGLFSVIAVLPAIILALFSSASLNRAMEGLFSQSTEAIVFNSIKVANAYLTEHGDVIRSDLLAMANDVDRFAETFVKQKTRFEIELYQQAQLRNLPVARVLDIGGVDRVPPANPLGLPLQNITPENMQRAATGEVAFVRPVSGVDQVGAITRLINLPDSFLYVAREVDSTVMEQVRATEQHATNYVTLQEQRQTIQISFGVMQLVLALTLLLSSVWMGLWFANRLVAPIRRLISAAQRVSLGDLDAQLEERRNDGDLAMLAKTFNHMTGELKKQRDELVSTNGLLTDRKLFIEAVLSGVSAGVIGLDRLGRVDLVNRAALTLLGRQEADLLGLPLADSVPEFGALAQALITQSKPNSRVDRTQQQVDLTIGGSERHFAVQVTRETATDRDFSSVVTFDDITGLVTAQRTSAWADVARRIAHEIKNPLTPIQLSAERLKRKFGSVIVEDREIFDRCTDTIINRVGDLGRMVDEFSSFARMPKPDFHTEDLCEVVRQATVLDQIGRSDIDIDVVVPDRPVIMACDRRLITQAIINLMKNAAEATQAVREQPDSDPNYRGHIEAVLAATDDTVVISIVDNGCGLPKKDRQRLVEPYNTTRAKGTGIGLAIVHKVTEQHGGRLLLEDAPVTELRPHGAAMRMVLPRFAAKADIEAATGAATGQNHAMARAPAAAEPTLNLPMTSASPIALPASS
jgi:two-component system, NtrC family, nitrogen regulation sensor histidine kinase NtrY